jgi:hypothetical protein
MKENFRFQRHKQEWTVDFPLLFPSHGNVLQTTKVEFMNICYDSRTELGTSKWQGSVMSVSEWAANKQSGRLGPVVIH